MSGVSNNKLKWFVRLAVVAAFVPILTATTCPNPTGSGSCCASNGTCSVTTQSGCSGTFTANGTCSPNPCGGTQTTLLSGTFTSQNSTTIQITQNPCYTAPAPAHNFLTQTFNAVTGKLVTCSGTGPTTASRPRIRVTDLFGSIVADSGGSPTTQTTTTTFTPTGTQLYILTMEDCFPSAAANYTVLVTQAP